jgi:hypothetical protein
MGLKALSAAGYFKKKYEIGDSFYDEDGIMLEKSKVWIMLKEPPTFEMNKFGDDKTQNIKLLMDLLPKCIIAHGGFTEEDGSEPTNEEVGKFLVGRANVFYVLVEDWQQDLPFVQKRQQKLKEQAGLSSSATQ